MTQNIEPEDQSAEQPEQGQPQSASRLSEQSDIDDKAPSSKPLTTQGTREEIEENLGGTTNLSLDQLKKEGDAGH